MGITSEEYPKITKDILFANLLKNSGTELKSNFEDFLKNPKKVTVDIQMYWGAWVTWVIIPEKIVDNITNEVFEKPSKKEEFVDTKIEEIPIPNKKNENELLRMGISEKGNSEILPLKINFEENYGF